MLKSNGALSTEEREEEMRQMEVYRSHSKFMKNKIGQVKQELSRKDTELLALQTKLETLTNQFSDSKQHIEVLKESLTAKEPRGLPSCRTRILFWWCSSWDQCSEHPAEEALNASGSVSQAP
ncbi:ELKS/Rab6-interacting/CAST family member 1-like isoform 3-T13 [Megaptera novaeangliae]